MQLKEAQQRCRCLSSWGFFTVSAHPSHLNVSDHLQGSTHWKETMTGVCLRCLGEYTCRRLMKTFMDFSESRAQN